MSRPCLKRRHKLESAYTKSFSRFSTRIRVNGPPAPKPMDPPSRKKKHGPLGQWTPRLERRLTARAIDTGEGWYHVSVRYAILSTKDPHKLKSSFTQRGENHFETNASRDGAPGRSMSSSSGCGAQPQVYCIYYVCPICLLRNLP